MSSRAGASTCCLEAKGMNHGHADVSRLCYIAAACCLTADAGPRSHGVKLTRYAFHASAEDGAPLRLAMHGQDLFRRACALCPIPVYPSVRTTPLMDVQCVETLLTTQDQSWTGKISSLHIALHDSRPRLCFNVLGCSPPATPLGHNDWRVCA